MSKVGIESNPMYKGHSKIPRALPIRYSDMENANYMRKPSRLLQMQADLQRKLMQEKEEKLINIYEQNQSRALQRVNNNFNRDISGRGHVRGFFHERRKMEQTGAANIPDINRHYQLSRNDYNSQSSFHSHLSSRGSQRSATSSIYSKTSSAGIDRANPLAPIETIQTSPQHQKKAALMKSNKRETNPGNGYAKKPTRPNALQVPQADYAVSSAGSTPPPNLAKLRQIQQNRLQNKTSPIKPIANGGPKQTDFQKWQAEQEQSRAERLKKYNKKNMAQEPEEPMDEDQDSVNNEQEISRKQQELLDILAQREQELEMLKIEREREEEEGRKEMERRRDEQERRRREDEERRLREEEERRRYEEKERQREEEAREKRISSHDSPAKRRNENRGYQAQMNDFGHEPSPPPPKFKPKLVRRRTTSKHSAPSPTEETSAHPSANTDIYRAAALSEDAFSNENVRLVDCSNCGRQFADDRLAKHKQICTGMKKRKQFNSHKARIEGTDLAQFRPPPNSEPKVKKSNWRKKREDFIQALRYAKSVTKAEAEGVDIASLPPPPRTENPDYVPCPHCNRTFNVTAAERHIPRCQNIKTKPAPPRRR